VLPTVRCVRGADLVVQGSFGKAIPLVGRASKALERRALDAFQVLGLPVGREGGAEEHDAGGDATSGDGHGRRRAPSPPTASPAHRKS
jgi:hypothetical protein